jgi:hypothetical protein
MNAPVQEHRTHLPHFPFSSEVPAYAVMPVTHACVPARAGEGGLSRDDQKAEASASGPAQEKSCFVYLQAAAATTVRFHTGGGGMRVMRSV